MNLKKELEELDGCRNSHERGKQFEVFLAHMLSEEGLDVTYNPRATPPHQTDLSARGRHVFFIVEAKWLRKRLYVGYVTTIRDRLNYTPPGVFACVFSMSGYSESAVNEFCRDRTREIILFDGREVRTIVAGSLSFEELLNDKRDALRTYSGAMFWRSEGAPPNSFRIKSAPDVFRMGNETVHRVKCTTGIDDVLFSNETLDFQARQLSAGYSLYMRVDPGTISELRRLLHVAEKKLGLTTDSSFSIHQREVGWFGFGRDSFLTAIEKRELRYRELNWDNYHHSEELGYVSRIENGGVFCLSSRQSTTEGNHIHTTEIEILLPGIPVDMDRIKAFCRLMHNPEARIESIREYPIKTHRFRPRVEVEPVGEILSDSHGRKWVSGLVVKNPFFGKRPPFAESNASEHIFRMLSNYEILFCTLGSWHHTGVRMDHYQLRFIEGGFLGNYPVFWIVCDWI